MQNPRRFDIKQGGGGVFCVCLCTSYLEPGTCDGNEEGKKNKKRCNILITLPPPPHPLQSQAQQSRLFYCDLPSQQCSVVFLLFYYYYLSSANVVLAHRCLWGRSCRITQVRSCLICFFFSLSLLFWSIFSSHVALEV